MYKLNIFFKYESKISFVARGRQRIRTGKGDEIIEGVREIKGDRNVLSILWL